MELATKKETIIHVNAEVLDSFIESVYGHDASITSVNEWDEGAYYKYSVKKNVKMYDFDVVELNDFIENGYVSYSTISLIMNDLCDKGLIEEGNYFIFNEGH